MFTNSTVRECVHTLVTFQKNWADEFDCQEFILLSQSFDETQKHLQKFLNINPELYFGTNEGWYGEFRDGDFSIEEITPLQFKTLNELLGKKFGVGVLHHIFNTTDWDNGSENDN